MRRTRCRVTAFAVVMFIAMMSTSVSAADMDERIVASARQSYVFHTYLKDDDINLQSKDGNVQMTGTVSEEAHKALANEMVSSLPGVKSVDNKLKIKPGVQDKYSDGWILAKVKTTLLFHRNVSARKTEVFVKNGVVTLRGEAESAAQKDLATEYANDIDGVASVNNEMIVATLNEEKMSLSKNLDGMAEAVDDASITAMVKTALLYHRSTSSLRTTVKTNDGVVTLSGMAKNAAEKDLASKIVSDVHGVRNVVNNMVVSGVKDQSSAKPMDPC